MKFTAKEDIEAPMDAVFDMITDFEGFERMALRRGAEVQRKDDLETPGIGMQWDVAFKFRGKKRQVRLDLVRFDRPNGITAAGSSPNMEGAFTVDLIKLSKSRTRMSVEMNIKAKNLASRLLLQSLKLAKTNLTKRFKLRAAAYAKDLEDRYSRMA